jgi:predicted DCC family thiol-disulfide oxidoreductase YuxK
VRLVGALDRHRRVTAMPFQRPGFPEAHGLTVAQCEQSVWAITPDGFVYCAAGAASLTAAVILGSPLSLWLYLFPGIHPLQEAAYRWVARNRSHFPGDRPYCEQHPEECGEARAEG